jgi:hypothetical protein
MSNEKGCETMDFDILPKWLQELPFGAENEPDSGQTDGNSAGNSGQQSNQQGSQGNSLEGDKSLGNGKVGPKPTNDDDDEFSGLSAADLRRRLKEETGKTKTLETERDSFKSKVDESERAQRTKEENLENDLRAAQTENEELRSVNDSLAIINGILTESAYTWHDVNLVAKELDSSVVKVDKSGKVEGLKKDLQRLAKDKPFLLKGTQNNGGSNGGNTNGPTGFQPGQGGAHGGNNAQKANAAELAKKFPALASRV